MKTGWVRIHRKIEDNPLYFSEPFTKAQAWIDLLIFANHKDESVLVRGSEIHVKRGQLCWSEVTMAKRWRWSRNKVRRFLKWLKTKQQTEQVTIQQKTSLITIINYESYQSDEEKRNTNNNIRNKNINNIVSSNEDTSGGRPANKEDELGVYLERFNSLFGKNYQKTEGRRRKLRLRLKSFSVGQILEALENLSANKFYHGENDRGWEANPDFLIRNDEQIDRFLQEKPVAFDIKQEELTEQFAYDLAIRLDIPLPWVHKRVKMIMEMVKNGDFQSRNRKLTVSQALEKWVESDLSKGWVSHCNEIEKIDLQMANPKTAYARKKKIQKLIEQDKKL